MSKKIKSPEPEIDKSLDCADMREVSLRCRFQDWITVHIGCLTFSERNRLWSKFKRGKLIKVRKKTIPFHPFKV